MEGRDSNITVSRDLLRAELSALELRIVDRLTGDISKKADGEELRSLRHRVATIEAQRPLGDRLLAEFNEMKTAVTDLREHGSGQVRELAGLMDRMERRVGKLELWRSYLAGAVAVSLGIGAFALDVLARHYL